MKMVEIATVCFLLVMGMPVVAHAYLDPGTGSYVLQILIASLLGAGFFIKTQWHRIKALVSRLIGRKDEES